MKKLSLITILIALLTACAAPLGTITVHTVGDDNKLMSPLVESKQLINDQNTIFKTEQNGNSNGDDVFAIYLTDTYLRYLKDWGGINEVLIVVEFTEAVTGTTQDTITKILGPYNNIADATRAPLLNKALYGPKKMESDLLTMNIKVYEYDLEENENNAAMLEFIAGSASTLALADPVTLGEIKIAKEIAQTLIRTNENDLVVNMDFDFVAGNKKYKNYSKSRVLPLKDSELVVVKQEACRIGTCWDYFSNYTDGVPANGPGVLTDIVMLVPTTIVKATTDVADAKSLEPLKAEEISVTDDGLSKDGEAFTDKTWLRFSIVKGGDPSQWAVRKALYPQEEEINKLLRNPNALTVENMKAMTSRIEKIQQEIAQLNADIQLKSKLSVNGTHFIPKNAASSSLCFDHSENVDVLTNQAVLFLDAQSDQTVTLTSQSKSSTCYTLAKSSFTNDTGKFQVNYKIGKQNKTASFPVIVADALAGTPAATCSKNIDDNKNTITITLTQTGVKQVESIQLNGHTIPFSIEGDKIKATVSDANPTLALTDVFDTTVSTLSLTCN
ncbi:hypothetical protein BFC18_18255 [Alteromonas confluentis]|uniref:Lipoprotein n=2 Tax=Alteromonas confluentis TaxID=1656094 RepID=A0A1E7Z798_9ALTE|nr:hypothetical protein BFC18_18255 [Alteromonas confluentis]